MAMFLKFMFDTECITAHDSTGWHSLRCLPLPFTCHNA